MPLVQHLGKCADSVALFEAFESIKIRFNRFHNILRQKHKRSKAHLLRKNI